MSKTKTKKIKDITKQKNHFYIGYFGNKRNESYNFYQTLNFENITTIVEPYCGSQAISYYIWTKHPDLKFILNDNNKFLKIMYNILKDDVKITEFENKINNELLDLIQDKKQYDIIVKQDDVYSWFIKNKFYSIRPGIFPSNGKFKKINLLSFPIINFYKNANIEFTTDDGINTFEKYKMNKEAIIIMDPPYLNTCNNFYLSSSVNIYEYLYNNNINQYTANIYLILEDIWIIRMLFSNSYIVSSHTKTYETTQKKTTHLTISNKSEPLTH